MKRKINTCLAIGFVVAFAAMQSQAIETRFNTAGSWTNDANWSLGTPGPTDLARLQEAIAADIDSVEVIGGLNFRGDPTLGTSIINVFNGGSLTSDGTQFSGINRIGSDGDATFNIYSGGSAIFSGTGNFELAQNSGSNAGYLNVNGGSLTVSQNALIGDDGVGVLTVTNGGTATFNSGMTIGNTGTANGTVTLHSGTVDVASHVKMTDNVNATATLNVHGGTFTTAASLQIRDGTGYINQTGGAINAADLFVGHLKNSTGTMTMSGGTNTITGSLVLGNQDNGSAAQGASGTLNMSGGYMTVSTLEVGAEASTSGELTLSGTDTYLKATTLRLGDAGLDASSTVTVADGLFQIHSIDADGDTANESLFLEGGVLKLRHADTSTGYDDAVALIDAGVLTWTASPLDSLAATYDPLDADVTWTNGEGVTLYADTDGTNYSYMWTETIPEPATLGMVALFGTGIILFRRHGRI